MNERLKESNLLIIKKLTLKKLKTMYFWHTLIIIIIIIILIIWLFMSEKQETHTHPKPIHDQKSGKVIIRGSVHHGSFQLLMKSNSTQNIDEVSKGPDPEKFIFNGIVYDVVDMVVTNGLTKNFVLNTGLNVAAESSNLLVKGNSDPEVYQITATNTAPMNFQLGNVETEADPSTFRLAASAFLGTTSFDYNPGDKLIFNNLDCQCTGLELQIRGTEKISGAEFTISPQGPLAQDVAPGDTQSITFSQPQGTFEVFGKAIGEFFFSMERQT